MSIYEVKGATEELTENILGSIFEEVKLINRIQNMTPEARMRMFQVYFRGLKDGLSIASEGLLDQEKMRDPIIDIINNDIISTLKEIEEPLPAIIGEEQYKIWKNARDEILAKHFQIVDVK